MDAETTFHVERFWSYVDRSGGAEACWPWTRSVFPSTGYGQATTIRGLPGSPMGPTTTAHRQAWIITNGDPGTHRSPLTGQPVTNRVRHRCPGGPLRTCCNPTHLRVGSDQDNADDRAADGNQPRGTSAGGAKLTEAQVRTARWLHANKAATIYRLAKLYNVGQATMAAVVYYRTWKDIR